MQAWFSSQRLLVIGLMVSVCLASPASAQEETLDADPDLEEGIAADSGSEDGAIWRLGFKFQALRTFSPRSGPNKGLVYWYMLYELENKSEEDREFFVSISAKSDRNKTYFDMFLPSVERGIEKKLGRSYWGQADKFKILTQRDPKDEKYNYTTIKGGEKRRCIAVFNRLDPNANNIEIEVYGLSNDIESELQTDGSTVIRERVRLLRFKRRGDEYEIDQDALRPVDRGWIKKQTTIKAADDS